MEHITSIETRKELIATIKRSLAEVLGLIDSPAVTDIEYNTTSNRVFYDGKHGRQKSDFCYPPERARSFLNGVATYHGVEINEASPILSVRLPAELHECRLQANIAPVTDGVSFALRKPGALYPISDYVNGQVKRMLHEALRTRKNILLAGSTGAGKTSFLNSVLHELKDIAPGDRLNILEDTHEVQCDFSNHEFYATAKDRNGNEVLSMGQLVKNSMRMNPDRIIIGEVRDKAAYHVLEAWYTGHEGGLCTLHAGGAIDGFDRFFDLTGMPLNKRNIRKAARAIDYVFFLSKQGGQRAVREVAKVFYDRQAQREDFEMIYRQQAGSVT
jgi:type IV secretion system protein VirB11